MTARLARDPTLRPWLSINQEGDTMKATLCYMRYVVSALASIGFEVAMN